MLCCALLCPQRARKLAEQAFLRMLANKVPPMGPGTTFAEVEGFFGQDPRYLVRGGCGGRWEVGGGRWNSVGQDPCYLVRGHTWGAQALTPACSGFARRACAKQAFSQAGAGGRDLRAKAMARGVLLSACAVCFVAVFSFACKGLAHS